ncbi:MAG: putative DNA-binding domain-containing protein [Burkholderiales bacterium]|nr:putative DNA-binding domain-containing protein [Burkholderiales bacterium]
MNNSLVHVQQVFQAYVSGSGDTADALPLIAETPGLTCASRLDIYYQAYRLRLRDALSDAFDKTHRYLGDQMFYAACAEYIAKTPSHTRNLRWYGNHFPEFLSQYFSDYPFVAELAQFEWVLSLAFDAEDQPVLDLSGIAGLNAEDWETAGFQFQASLRFIELRWNVVPIWLALGEDQTPPEPIEAPLVWLVWRKQLQAHFRSLDEPEYQALQNLIDGHRFSEVCANALNQSPEAADKIGAWLQTWLAEEMLSAVYSV